MKKIIPFFLILIFVGYAFGQNERVNDLYKKFHSEPQKLYENAELLRHAYLGHSVDSLYSLGSYTLESGIENDNYPLIVLGKLILGNYYARVGKADLSQVYLQQCIFYYKRKNDLANLADAENLMGMSYLNSNNHPKAIDYFIRSYESSKNLPDDNESFQGQINLAEVYLRDGQYDLAEAETLSYLDRVKKRDLQTAMKRSYDMLGKIYFAKKDTKLAFQYFHKALVMALKGDVATSKAHSYNNIAIAYFENDDLELSKINFQKALEMRTQVNDPIGISESHYNIGDWYYYQELYKEAIPHYFKSLQVADSNQLLKESADAIYKIAMCFENIGNFKLASEFYHKNIKAIIKINKKQQTKQLDMQRMAFELQQKEDRLSHAKRENVLRNKSDKQRDRAKVIVVIFSILTSGLLLLYLFAMFNRKSKKTKKVSSSNLIGDQKEQDVVLADKWEALEGFIDFKEKDLKQTPDFLSDKIKFTSNIQLLQMDESNMIYWETDSSKLESYVFNNYMFSKSKEIVDFESFSDLVVKQELIDPKKVTCGVIHKKEDRILVCGNNGLLIQNENKMAFMTENRLDVKEYSVFVSENLKNYLIDNEMWEKFLKQIDMTSKMSSNMALSTLEDSWGEVFDLNQLGVFVIHP